MNRNGYILKEKFATEYIGRCNVNLTINDSDTVHGHVYEIKQDLAIRKISFKSAKL